MSDGSTAPVGNLGTKVEGRATLLAYAGLFPFLLLAIVLWVSPWVVSYNAAGNMLGWCTLYSALLLSFLGGIRWGFALFNDDRLISDYVTITQLTNSIWPVLICWILIVPNGLIRGISPSFAMIHGVMLILYWVMMYVDVRASEEGFAPPWYGDLRKKITFFLTLIFILTITRLINFNW